MSASKINIIGKNWPWSFLSIKTVKDCVSWCFFREISGGGNPFYHQQTRFTAKSLHAVYSALCKACFLQSQRLFLLILHHTSETVIRFDGFLSMWILQVAEYILLFQWGPYNLKITLKNIKPKALNNFKGQVIKGQFMSVKVLF